MPLTLCRKHGGSFLEMVRILWCNTASFTVHSSVAPIKRMWIRLLFWWYLTCLGWLKYFRIELQYLLNRLLQNMTTFWKKTPLTSNEYDMNFHAEIILYLHFKFFPLYSYHNKIIFWKVLVYFFLKYLKQEDDTIKISPNCRITKLTLYFIKDNFY